MLTRRTRTNHSNAPRIVVYKGATYEKVAASGNKKGSIPFEYELHTSGRGLWSSQKAAVQTTKLELWVEEWDEDEDPTCYLRLYFNTASFRISQSGFIYTDPKFLRELNMALRENDLPSVDYTEQGMQGRNYVSLCANNDHAFLEAWTAQFGRPSERARYR